MPLDVRKVPSRCENIALSSRPFRQGTCAPRRGGGQVRYLNGYDLKALIINGDPVQHYRQVLLL